ncbi:hypothetical protein [Stieleria sp.]|uniref:hypothetical protein n=1 Tax=Stieleria sp. TaxID=2795976 RepID=UPI003562ADE1
MEWEKQKAGQIPEHLAPILRRIGLDSHGWCELVTKLGMIFKRAAAMFAWPLRTHLDLAARRSSLHHCKERSRTFSERWFSIRFRSHSIFLKIFLNFSWMQFGKPISSPHINRSSLDCNIHTTPGAGMIVRVFFATLLTCLTGILYSADPNSEGGKNEVLLTNKTVSKLPLYATLQVVGGQVEIRTLNQ